MRYNILISIQDYNEGIDLIFYRVTLKNLKNGKKMYPLDADTYIHELEKEIVHFVSKQI